MENYKPLGIYIHIPFCKKKCEYCDFYSEAGPRDKSLCDDYTMALFRHIQETADYAVGYQVDTVYFGGGTPTFFGDQGLRRILTELDKRFIIRHDAEITFEANPDSMQPAALQRLRKAGFNRISIGIQSNSNAQLKALGRPHNYKQAVQAVAMAKSAGFDNVSVDLMYGLPGQTREQWADCLQDIIDLKAPHISCYGLRVEEGTPLFEYKDCVNLPDDDMQADMYLYAAETLEAFGYHQYEVSNFSKKGYECRHNLKYWFGMEYLGFGPAAASYFGNKRYSFRRNVRDYTESIFNNASVLAEVEPVLPMERASEYLMLRLRTSYGVNEADYVKRFHMDFEPLEKIFRQLKEKGLATQEGKRWRLTSTGFLLSNPIIISLQEAQKSNMAQWMDQGEL